MKCSKCGSDNRERVKFCEECGAKLELECPTCKAKIPLDKKFCGECGHALIEPQEIPAIDYSKPQSYTPKYLADKILTNRSALEGERKLVTVLFADVSNYTAMSEALDPEEVHQIMDGCFNILMDEIHRFEGTVNQFTGDGVMALFGAPLAHEDHAQRACHAALSIQKKLRNYSKKIKQDYGFVFKMRIGLNSGPVVVASIGDDLRMDYTAIGDTTNLAARMESKAVPGRILISGATHKLVKDFFAFNPLGKIEVKGKEQPQEAYELIKVGDIETRISASVAKGLTKFVGRKSSMATIKEAFEKALSGSGQVVGIVGEAGVGKSRLLFEFVNQLPLGETKYLEGRCLHFGSGMVYLPILDMLRSFFEVKEGDQESVIKEKLLQKIRQMDERLLDTLPSFQELLSVKVDDEKYVQLDPGHKKMRTFEAIRNLFIRESEKHPLVLAIEDLHWIDKTSEECISYLIDWLANTHIMLILLHRLEYNHQWGSKSYYTKIGLTQLGTVSSRLLVEAILEDDQVPSEIRDLVLSRAGGNPLFVEELTHSLMESGTIARKGHEYILTRDLSEIVVPETIQGIIAARIDRIEESMKNVIQMASVIGREFAFRILQSIIEMKKDLKSHLLNLQGLEFISQKRLFPELEYIFKHALTQEVAYNSLLQKRRKELHEKIGMAIESLYLNRLEEYYELLAYHFGKGGNADKAVTYLDLAIRKAVMVNAMDEALNHFNQAMELLDGLPENKERSKQRISLLVNMAIAFFQLYQYPEYRKVLARFKPVAELLEDQRLSGSYWARIGHCQWWLGDSAEGLQNLTKAAKICEGCEDFEEAGYVYLQMQWLYKLQARYNEVFFLHKRSLRMVERAFRLRYYVWAESAAAWSYACIGQWDNAVEVANRALKVSQDYSDKSMIAFAAFILCLSYTLKGDLDHALQYGELSVRSAPTPGDRAWSGEFFAWALCRSKKTDQGIKMLNEILPPMRGRGPLPEIHAVTALGEGYWLAGDDEKAKFILESSCEHSERVGYKWYLGWAQRILGEISKKKETTRAVYHFERSLDVFREIKAENELALSYAAYGKFHKQQGDIGESRAHFNAALEIFERLGTPIEPEKVRKELVELPNA
jgi:class 3 adenylate cyclase/tetratricopeptide (TPR) repeat protein